MIDSHAHLDDRAFDDDRPEMIARARAAGLEHVVLIGMTPRRLQPILDLTVAHPDFFTATAGVHPHDAALFSDDTEQMVREALQHPRVTALGEIGLDWFRDYAPAEDQHRAFRRQLEVAVDVQVPFVLHCRDAHKDCVSAIREVFGDQARPRSPGARPIGVAHCFSGNAEQAAEFVSLGLLVSWAGHVSYKKNEALRDAIRATEPHDWLVETDAPYLAPTPHRGKRNEPAFVVRTAEVVAEAKGIPIQEVEQATDQNARLLFDISSTSPS